MRLNEAYSILELSPNASSEEAKKKYRELTKKYHPDVNKDPGAEDKFKKINEAYKIVQNGELEPDLHNFHNHSQYFIKIEHINVYTTISFKDSVLGKKQEVKFVRNSKCAKCDGRGEVQLNNGCSKCNGKGRVISQERGFIVARTCDQCNGKMKFESCNTCKNTGSIESTATVSVNIPAGVADGNILRLGGMGNYIGNMMGFEQFTDTYVHVTVEPEEGLSILGTDVISSVDLSLLEALNGCTKQVKTILGTRDIEIKPLSRNRDEVIIPKLGVKSIGNHKVILNVSYPDDISKLIKALKESEEN